MRMPNPNHWTRRTRAVAAYEAGGGGLYVAIAEQFAISVSSLLRWVERTRAQPGIVLTPRPKGGWVTPDLLSVVRLRGDCRAPGRDGRGSAADVQPPGGGGRAREPIERRPGLAALGIGKIKKRPRPSEVGPPHVHAKRARFRRWMRRVDPARLVVLDESGANLAMDRSHAWVHKRGHEFVEPRPMNWGTNLNPARRHSRDNGPG